MSQALVEPFSGQPSHEVDLNVNQLVLDVSGRRVTRLATDVAAAITDGTLERTVDGASTLTVMVHDPHRALLLSGLFSQAIDVRLDRLYWRLVKVSKQGDDLTLTFEDREVAQLRTHASPRKAPRAKTTRAEFALSLVREVKPPIPFVCPVLHVKQPIETASQAVTDTTRLTGRGKGLAAGAKLTVKGAAATLSQRRLGEQVLDVADSLNAGVIPTLALLEACIVEDTLHNSAVAADHDSRGVLQVRDSTARPMGINNLDPSQCANAFLTRGFYTDPQLGGGGAIAIATRHPEVTAGRVAQASQGSGKPAAYDTREAEAKEWLAAYHGANLDGSADTSSLTKALPYQYQRGGADGTTEDSWTCLQRLAQEVNWRCFMSAGSLYFVPDAVLMRAKPRLLLSETDAAVLGIDFDLDNGKAVQEVTVTARARRWTAGPGTVVQLRNCGPADGRWLVATISRSLFEATASITLHRAQRPLPEPAPETTTTSVGLPSAGGAASGLTPSGVALSGSQMARVVEACNALNQRRFPYVWGGGHARAGTPDHGQSGHADSAGTVAVAGVGFDCSGSTCAVLAAAGMGFTLGGPVWDSGRIAASWGYAGAGSHLTVWANKSHVWMEVEGVHFGTGDWGKGWGGAGWNPNMHPKDGFVARHWPEPGELPNAYGADSPRSNRPG